MLCHSDLWQWWRHPKKVTQAHGGQRFNPSANLKLGRILETLGAVEEKERSDPRMGGGQRFTLNMCRIHGVKKGRLFIG